jgi:hypothetical protein
MKADTAPPAPTVKSVYPPAKTSPGNARPSNLALVIEHSSLVISETGFVPFQM